MLECWPARLSTSTSASLTQPRTVANRSPQYVSRLTGPPSTDTAYASRGPPRNDRTPSRVEVQATCVADGFSRGCSTGARSAVSRHARVPRLPSASPSEASQTSSSAAKVIRSRATCG